MVATSGAKLISEEAIGTLKKRLLPIASVLTPNIPEAEVLAEMEIHSADDMIEAAKKISDTYHCAVLCKGGHKLNDANDLLYRDGDYRWFNGKRIDNPNTHGTGCTLSSAIASNLAKGFDMDTSVELSLIHICVEHSKLSTVKALQSIGFDTIASGDSYNDLGMIQASKAGFL